MPLCSKTAFNFLGAMLSNVPNDIRQSMRKYYEDTMKRYMSDLQAGVAAGKEVGTAAGQPDQAPSLSTPQQQPLSKGHALDLTSSPVNKQDNVGPAPALDLSKPEGQQVCSSLTHYLVDHVRIDILLSNADNSILCEFRLRCDFTCD